MNTQHKRTLIITQLAILLAIMLALETSGIGMLRIGPLEMTILQVPVIIAAIAISPGAGAAMGLAFGLISFWECFGKSLFGATILSINPFLTFLVCVPTRTLMGWLCGLIFQMMLARFPKGLSAYVIAGLSGALLNTAFFMTALILFFGRSEYIMSMRGELSLPAFLAAFVGLQGLVEALICAFLGSTIGKAVVLALKK